MQKVFTAALAVAGVLLGRYAWATSPHEHALLNAEGAVALSFLVVLFLRGAATKSLRGEAGISIWWLVAIPVVTVLAFAGTVNTPFLYDDYTHITEAARATWAGIAQQFGPVAHKPGLFFRPLGFAIYWLNYRWIDAHQAWWHAASLGLHMACAFLLFILIRSVGLSRWAGLAGALMFAVNGVTAETVAWIDARFDLIATLFSLVCLIAILRYGESGGLVWLVAALAAGAAAMLTKESAFALPLLASCFPRNRRGWRAVISMAILAALLFAYRWWALGGLGGYAARPNVLHALNALFFRQWALLFFPLNWTAPAGTLVRAAACAVPVALLIAAWIATPSRRMLAGAVAFVIACALPVQHLMTIGTSLGNSRFLYMGAVGWAVLWAVVFDGMTGKMRIVMPCVLLLLEIPLLESNLAVWRENSELAQSTCAQFGALAADKFVVVRGLPATRRGAVFLANGFSECVEMNSGVPAGRILIRDAEPDALYPGVREFRWNESRETFEQSR